MVSWTLLCASLPAAYLHSPNDVLACMIEHSASDHKRTEKLFCKPLATPHAMAMITTYHTVASACA